MNYAPIEKNRKWYELEQKPDRVDEMSDKFPILFNYIDSRNKLHLTWLKWCGFKIINEKTFNDVLFVMCVSKFALSPKRVYGPYYCTNKANEVLITLLRKGVCAWVSHDVRKTEFWRVEKSRSRRSCTMEKLG